MILFVCYLSGQVWTDADSASLSRHLKGEADYSSDLQKRFLTQASLVLHKRGRLSSLEGNSKNHYCHACVCFVSLLTVLSSPWMCRVTDLDFLLVELIKNWDFFLFCLSGVRGTGLAGELRMPNTSCAKIVTSTERPSLYGEKKCNVVWSQTSESSLKISNLFCDSNDKTAAWSNQDLPSTAICAMTWNAYEKKKNPTLYAVQLQH